MSDDAKEYIWSAVGITCVGLFLFFVWAPSLPLIIAFVLFKGCHAIVRRMQG